ncbi:MAG: cell division protein FtsA [Tannerellaceae bacterium]|jgi:cell division protein FtsA|nr:cell division protein FtsA [Tannerellaceae bacterium]
MANTDFIAAIYLGTSRITGIVGRNEAGTLVVVAYETEISANCIVRGCVHNVKETAARVKKIIRNLELKIPGSRIGKVYVGVGGQSIRSVEHTVSISLKAESIVTDELMDSLHKECETYLPDGLEVLSVLPSAYYLDGRMEPEPVGISCSRIEAKYNLIVARPSLRRLIVKSITEMAQIEIADIRVAPLVLADVVLSESEKSRGCALIDFGAGVTSLSVYKDGKLVRLCVIPLGGNLITRDIGEYLKIEESEAEPLKRKYGNALVSEADDSFQINQEQKGLISVQLADFNHVVTARLQEILENVYDKLEGAVEWKALRAGIIITGKAANLENLTAAIYNRTGIDVRYASIRGGLNVKNGLSDTFPDGVTLGLLLHGKVNCAVIHTPAPPPVRPQPPTPPPTPVVESPEQKPPTRSGKKQKPFDRFIKKASGFVGEFFDEGE